MDGGLGLGVVVRPEEPTATTVMFSLGQRTSRFDCGVHKPERKAEG